MYVSRQMCTFSGKIYIYAGTYCKYHVLSPIELVICAHNIITKQSCRYNIVYRNILKYILLNYIHKYWNVIGSCNSKLE